MRTKILLIVFCALFISQGAFARCLLVEGQLFERFNFRYSTKYYDPETKLYYYGHRYYSADLKRWVSRDPMEEKGGKNLYGFVKNTPINTWDILGQFSSIDDEFEEDEKEKLIQANASARRNIIDAYAYLITALTVDRVKKDFKGSQEAINRYSKWQSTMTENLKLLWNVVSANRYSAIKGYAGDEKVFAYVSAHGFSSKIYFKCLYFKLTADERAAILVHELSHTYLGTDDSSADYLGSGAMPWQDLLAPYPSDAYYYGAGNTKAPYIGIKVGVGGQSHREVLRKSEGYFIPVSDK